MIILEKSLAFLKLPQAKTLDLQEHTRKKTYLCLHGGGALALIYSGKARFLLKDALFLEDLREKICAKHQISPSKKYFFLQSLLCSKAKNLLLEKGFIVHAFV